jgi:beta-xylosidase
MRQFLAAILVSLMCVAASAQEATPDYKNPKLPPEQRAADLLKRMTLEEKVEQISGHRKQHVLDPTGRFNDETAEKAFHDLYDVDAKVSPRDAAILRNAAQRYLLEKTRLGIPNIFFGEALHGYMEYGSTSFPQVLGLASTWDPELIFRVFTAAGDEMASAGTNQAFTPVLDLARDPRWGRTEETYGEDPYLVSRMGVAAVNGLQGTNYFLDRHHVIATAKHFAGHGEPEGGRNTAPVNISERILRESFFEPFQAVVRDANVGSVMASYHEINGVPSHINPWLLTKVLREEWGFRGYVTSDGNGLQMLYETHGVAADKAEAARKAIAAGIDYDLSDGSVYQTLLQQVKDGAVPESEVDRAVYWVLYDKFRLGLFENPYVDPDYTVKVTNSSAHQQLALQTAEKAIVLLKNQGNLLPLDTRKIKTIAVIGPNAADVHLGGYARDPGRGVSILQGIKDRVGPNVKVLYAEGCKITLGKEGYAGWYENDVKLPAPGSETANVKAAADLAKKADVAIVIVGENETSNREAWSENHLGDRDSLDLLGEQDELVKSVVATGVPTVVFLINGRPLSINYVAEHVPAIVEGWYLGQEGGTAAAKVIFGDVSPGGKLPITFPRSVGQLPDYYDHKPSRNRSYAFVNNSPLFAFGFGLSYTNFKFENVRLEPTKIGPGGTAKVTVDVTNTGTREGDEVPQMYIHQRVSSVTQPVMQLRGFQRISLKPGEKKTVEFPITPDTLAILDINMNRTVEPGMFDIMVGSSSAETQKVPLEVIAK